MATTVTPVSGNGAIHRPLVVAIHDVAPPFEAEVRAQLRMLAEAGVGRCVLKVVPNWHGAHSIPMATSLVELLNTALSTGSELVLHGLEHRRRGALRGGWLNRVRAGLFAKDAAEFMTLTAPEAASAAQAGLNLLTQAGLPRPTAFCAPGWLLTAEAEHALRDVGIRRIIGMFTVRDLFTGRQRVMPGFGYMGAPPWHETPIQVLNWLVQAAALPRATAAKVYLHPQGNLRGVALRRTMVKISLMVNNEGWRPVTYDELLP